jgi:hypothetical protein
MNTFMHRYHRYLIMLISLPVFFTGTVAIAQQESEPEIYAEWRLKKESEDIQIYTRWIDTGENRMARQMHAVMKVDASLDACVMALTDDRQVKDWLNRAKEYYHFDETDSRHWYAYTQFKIPWPLNNQDLVTYNSLEQDKNTLAVNVTIEGSPERISEVEGVSRMVHFEGRWHFVPQADGTVQIDYYIFTKAKPILPRWIIDPIVEHGLWSTFYEMRKKIGENMADDVKLSFLSE